MSKTVFRAVIGKNFGDEGKGQLTDFLCRGEGPFLVVRCNGGAQSGHTVCHGDKRFVFHELSSGSFCHADTFWAESFHPDLFKLSEELRQFSTIEKRTSRILADEKAQITVLDDVLVNMAAETARGEKRHGSCGMGIYECELRGKAGFAVTIGDLFSLSEEEILERLLTIRKEYLPKRLECLGLSLSEMGAYGEYLQDKRMLEGYVYELKEATKVVEPVENARALLLSYPEVIFENGQGLLLDAECEEFLPHVTASRTGLYHPAEMVRKCGRELDEVIYVSRSYVTRHGAGILPGECDPRTIGIFKADMTNVENPWQGRIRYAPHRDLTEFTRYVKKDFAENRGENTVCSLALTHMDSSEGAVIFEDRRILAEDFLKCPEITDTFFRCYLSFDRYSFEKAVRLHG